MLPTPLDRIAFVGNHVPRRCGLATFTRDLHEAVARRLPEADCLVVAMNDQPGGYDYPAAVRFACADADPAAYRRAARFLDLGNVDVVSLQHEYGIFGGPDGAHVLEFVRELRMPVHTTLHTVLARPSAGQRQVLDELLHLSARVAVMTERGRELLQAVHGVAADRIDVIPHGIPEMDFADPAFHKDRFGLDGASVLLTFGLLSPAKGIEQVIAALPEIVARHPRVVYLVVGATHPHLLRHEGERYRDSLVRQAADLGVADHVVFHDRYVDMPELLAFIAAADIYVTPYLSEDQITSGTLAYAFGCGKAVISTPYWHARELLADGRGAIVPFHDPAAIAREACSLLADDARRTAMRKQAWLLGREMVWGRVADRYAEALARTRLAMLVKPRRGGHAAPAAPRRALPGLVFDHLWRLTDSTGLLQHATYAIPALREGYCTDDNARALALMVLLEDLGLDSPRTVRAAATYAAFLGHAFDPASGRFRNLMAYDRRWLDDGESDDCLGRALVALGTCIGRSRDVGLQRFAMRFFEPAVRAMLATTSPRGWALAILGLQEYLRRLHGDRLAADARRELTDRLLALHHGNASHDWPWFEDVVAYENARPCQALISSGRWAGQPDALAAGVRMLEWLADRQTAATGRFAPVGCRGFLRRGEPAAAFDQQPIEAQAMVAACCEAYHATGDQRWLERAWAAFDWFHGHNVLGTAVGDPRTGGCRDGLLEDRANENQGAESTLAYLGSLVEMRFVEASTVDRPREPAAARGPGEHCGR
ncbi:MAG: glycosyltransferase [Pirellulales bacterium]